MLHILSLSVQLAVLTVIITCEPIPIVNGVTAVPLVKERDGEIVMRNTGRYPYVVFIQKPDSSCVGALVKDNAVLTAAHCTFEEKINIKVIAGTLDLHNDPLETKQERIVDSIIRHRDYKQLFKTGNPYDIAILRVAPRFTLNIFVNTIKLAKEDFIGTTAFVLGWGSTNTQNYSPLLLKSNLEISSAKTCKEELATRAENKFTKVNMLCARDPEKKQAICKGDSGGPLVVHKPSKKGAGVDVLVGLSSWGVVDEFKNKIHKCKPEYPSVFVRISKLRSWIKINADI